MELLLYRAKDGVRSISSKNEPARERIPSNRTASRGEGEASAVEAIVLKGKLVERGQIGGIDIDVETDGTFRELNFRADRHSDANQIISFCLFLSHTLE